MIEKKEEKISKEIKIDYYLNHYDKKECIIKFDNNKGFITYQELTENFFQYLKSTFTKKEEEDEDYYEYKDNYILNQIDINNSNIFYEYIRYLENGGWQLLKENGVIDFNDINDITPINIIIKASIISQENLIKKERYDLIQKQLKKIKLNINKQFKNNKPILDNNINNDIIDIVILTANPLMDEEKELRTFNDFNKIVSSIQDLIKESIKSINIQFMPLTKENFETILKKKPIILHLIFKSIYDINNNDINKAYKNSSDITFLIFEKKNYNTDFINKEEMTNILNEEMKQNIKNINLIISTSLAKDVYEIFNSFKFRNILVQHTTLANIDFISEFNYFFYENIIENKNCDIYDAYLSSLYQNSYNNITQFCCCFHQHDIKEKCDLVNNMKNELYINNDINIHFNHLNFNCECNKLYKNFSYHYDDCENMKKKLDKNESKNNGIINNKSNCCCKKNNKHSIEVAFCKSFKAQKTKNNKNKNNNNIINIGRNFEIKLIKDNNIPNYEKMILLVGKNRIIFETMNFLDQSNNNKKLNIYNDEIFNLKQLAEVIIEYSKERLISNYFIQYDIKSKEDFDNLVSQDNIYLFNLEKNKMKYIKFVFIHDMNDNIINKENILKFGNINKIIFFTKNEIQIDDKKMKKLKIEDLSKYDYYIKYQKEKIRFKTEKSFEEYISLKMNNKSK